MNSFTEAMLLFIAIMLAASFAMLGVIANYVSHISAFLS